MADPLPPNPFPFLTPSYAGGRNSICRSDTPYPSVSQESVPSQIDNLTNALYGSITKTVQNNRVIWNIPCDPTTAPATILGVSRNTNEGLLCYIIRALGAAIPTGFVTLDGIQTLTNKTLTAPVINSPAINNLTATGTIALPAGSITSAMIANGSIVPADLSTGGPNWDASGNFTTGLSGAGAVNCNNLTATGTISLPAQSITSSMIANGAIVDIDVSSSAAIAYSKLNLGLSIVNSDISVSAAIANSKLSGNPVSTNTASTIVLRDGTGNFSAGTITASLSGNATTAGTATNLAGTTANQIPYQSASGTTSYLAAGTVGQMLTQGASTPQWSIDHLGTTTNDNAPAGYVGEFVTSTVAVGSAVALTTGTTANVASLSLTAGDWDVRGQVDYRAGATTSITILKQGVSTTSATLGSQDSFTTNVFAAVVPTASNDIGNTFRQQRISIASTTTIYLVASATFTLSTLSAYGTISARRIR